MSVNEKINKTLTPYGNIIRAVYYRLLGVHRHSRTGAPVASRHRIPRSFPKIQYKEEKGS